MISPWSSLRTGDSRILRGKKLDPPFKCNSVGKVLFTPAFDLEISLAPRRALPCSRIFGGHRNAINGRAGHSLEELIRPGIAQSILMLERKARNWRHYAASGGTVLIKHVAESFFEESEVVFGEACAVTATVSQKRVNENVGFVEAVGKSELATHGAVAALLLVRFGFGGYSAPRDGVLLG